MAACIEDDMNNPISICPSLLVIPQIQINFQNNVASDSSRYSFSDLKASALYSTCFQWYIECEVSLVFSRFKSFLLRFFVPVSWYFLLQSVLVRTLETVRMDMTPRTTFISKFVCVHHLVQPQHSPDFLSHCFLERRSNSTWRLRLSSKKRSLILPSPNSQIWALISPLANHFPLKILLVFLPIKHSIRIAFDSEARSFVMRISTNLWYSRNGEDNSIHCVWNVLWLSCLRVGSLYQRSKLILSNKSSSTTLRFLTQISSSDFFLRLSF